MSISLEDVFKVKPNSQIYVDLEKTLETKVLKFELVEELFKDYKNVDNGDNGIGPNNNYNVNNDSELYRMLKHMFEMAVNDKIANMSEIFYQKYKFADDVRGKLKEYLNVWLINSGFKDIAFGSKTTQDGSYRYKWFSVYCTQNPTSVFSVEPNQKLYEDVMKNVEFNQDLIPNTAKDAVLSDEFIGKLYANKLLTDEYYPITNQLVFSSKTADSLSKVSMAPNYTYEMEHTQKSLEITAQTLTQWMKDSGFKDARYEMTGAPSFIVYAG